MGSGGNSYIGKYASMLEGDKGAEAAQAMAIYQDRAAKRAYAETAGIINPASTASLLQFDRALSAQDKNIARQEQLISQIDPTILEASQQALRLLRGESASTLAPLQEQRNQQRMKLLNQLREQLGPGAETSSAGLNALNRFDSETSQLMSGAQQQAIGGLGSLAGQFSQIRPDMLRETSALADLGTGRFNVANQQAQSLFAAKQPMLGTAGAKYTKQLMLAQRDAAYGRSFHESGLKVAEAWGTFGMGGKGGGTKTDSQTIAGGSNLDRENMA